VALNSAPEKGRANRELIEFIAQALGVAAAAVTIIRGQTAREKVIRIEASPPPQALAAKLLAAVNHAC
jgi:uncharacterized protein (TIGR00251 family)